MKALGKLLWRKTRRDVTTSLSATERGFPLKTFVLRLHVRKVLAERGEAKEKVGSCGDDMTLFHPMNQVDFPRCATKRWFYLSTCTFGALKVMVAWRAVEVGDVTQRLANFSTPPNAESYHFLSRQEIAMCSKTFLLLESTSCRGSLAWWTSSVTSDASVSPPRTTS